MENDNAPTALLNDLVLENMFENLSLSDINICRLVCTKWKAIGNLFLKERWIFPFWFTNPRFKDVSECVEDVDKIIHSNYQSLRNINFDKFHFYWSIESHTVELIAEVIKKYCEQCTELYILEYSNRDFYLRRMQPVGEDFILEPLPIFEITPYLGHNLTLLSVVSSSNFMSISWKCLTSVQYLYLANCTILLTGEIVKPKELLLSNVLFVRDEEVLSTVNLETFVDFRKMKKLHLMSAKGSFLYKIDEENKNVSLDNFHVLSRRSHNSKVNWHNLQWSVKSLNIDGVAVSYRDELNYNPRIKELEALDLKSVLLSDLTWIPHGIKKLSLNDTSILPDFRNQCNFSNLKHLSLHNCGNDLLDDTNDSISFLQYFNESLQNVEYLEVGVGTKLETRKLKSSMIPKNVKCILLNGNINLVCDDERVIDLEKLILCDYPWRDIEVLQYKLTADILVISSNIENGDEGCEKLIELILHHSSAFKSIAVGKFQWKTVVFDKNLNNFSMKQYVRDMANYYIFNERCGLSLESKDFDEMCNIDILTDYSQYIKDFPTNHKTVKLRNINVV